MDGAPRPIAMVAKSFSDEAARWSAFEREYYAFKEGFAAIAKWVHGFTVSTEGIEETCQLDRGHAAYFVSCGASLD